ncbi:MAG: VWA domain-containing protein [Acidimicrobiia bacterium]|nr:VWA domain-containing protein [Acidimicrobiia bacterium]
MGTTDEVILPVDHGERLAVGFCRILRQAGVRLPLSATIAFVEALGLVGAETRDAVYWAGRATLIHRPEDIALYDRVFSVYWQKRMGETVSFEGTPQSVVLALDLGEDDDADDGGDDVDENESEIQPVRFSRTEILTSKDFADCTKDELDELTRLMSRLAFTTSQRRSRRLTPAKGRGDRPDLRRTVRRALRHHGEPMNRAYLEKATRPRRLVLVLDVSGSMEPYARALIRFAHAAVVARGRVEVFALGTRLTRLTRHLTSRDPDIALRAALPEVKDWAGGTRLGEGIREFNDEWAIRGMARGSIVVILSDGWDRGDPTQLGEELERLHRVTRELIWVNPLKATPGYAPLAAGMAAALPHVDRFIEGHSYASLEQLAIILAGVGSDRVTELRVS